MKYQIKLKLFATLANTVSGNINDIQVESGTTVKDLMTDIGIQPEKIKLIFINGIKSQVDTKLKNGDRVGLFPPVGGG